MDLTKPLYLFSRLVWATYMFLVQVQSRLADQRAKDEDPRRKIGKCFWVIVVYGRNQQFAMEHGPFTNEVPVKHGDVFIDIPY